MPRLRRFILDLAVRGKLVPQDPSDEPASELLKRIAKEKARLVKAGEIRKPKPIPDADRTAFAIPAELALGAHRRYRDLSPAIVSDRHYIGVDGRSTVEAGEVASSNDREVRPWREIKTRYTHRARATLV